MPIAAVPAYLGNDFKDASPGMRFGMYLPLWGIDRRTQEALWKPHDIKYEVRGQDRQERPVEEVNKASALQAATALNHDDLARMAALHQRQHAAFAAIGTDVSRLHLPAKAIAPFTTGLGNEHPLENGFSFLTPYGLPYLPGSGVKGVLRQAARELASGEWGDPHGWHAERSYPITIDRTEVRLSAIDALFGYEPGEGETSHVRGALGFWDVFPQIKGKSLAVDIMTPHQGHYYQQKLDRKSGDSTHPHDSGSPNPITFLTIPPESQFSFHVVCDLPHLLRLAPELAQNDLWKTLLQAAFEHAFAWLGFGAKTSVGYGAMEVDVKAHAAAEEARATRQAAERRATLSPGQRCVEEFIAEFEAQHTQYPKFKEGPNQKFHQKAQALARLALESTDWSAEEKSAAADAIETWLPKLVQNIDMKEQRKKLKLAQLRGQG